MVNKCCFFILVVIGFISFIYFLDQYFVLSLSRMSNFDTDICNITRVDYPITLPTPENDDNWIRCDCGKYCQGWSPIISLYSDFNEDTLIKYSFDDDQSYTFGSNECPNGENVIDTMKRLNESINKARTYINASVDCYVNDNYTEIYLDLELDLLEAFIPLIILGLSLCGCFCMVIYYIYDKRKRKEKNTIEKLNEKIKLNESRREKISYIMI